ncbi:MAG TPA: hypothetical protein PKW33_11775 [Anaerolineaceae bacterium]|nr:hypothetical protein [Anaerolineaceae bacterium]HPN52258.1 hypothetical protein [Anaerolineaceae bacterium]
MSVNVTFYIPKSLVARIAKTSKPGQTIESTIVDLLAKGLDQYLPMPAPEATAIPGSKIDDSCSPIFPNDLATKQEGEY